MATDEPTERAATRAKVIGELRTTARGYDRQAVEAERAGEPSAAFRLSTLAEEYERAARLVESTGSALDAIDDAVRSWSKDVTRADTPARELDVATVVCATLGELRARIRGGG